MLPQCNMAHCKRWYVELLLMYRKAPTHAKDEGSPLYGRLLLLLLLLLYLLLVMLLLLLLL